MCRGAECCWCVRDVKLLLLVEPCSVDKMACMPLSFDVFCFVLNTGRQDDCNCTTCFIIILKKVK